MDDTLAMPPELAKMLDDAEQAMVPKDLKDKGWRYVDPPTKFSVPMWDLFLRLLGDGEYKIVIMSHGMSSDGFEWKRGQFFISPEGMRNLADRERLGRLSP